jgi:hypothetical protein
VESQSWLVLNNSALNSNAPLVRSCQSPFAISCAPFRENLDFLDRRALLFV